MKWLGVALFVALATYTSDAAASASVNVEPPPGTVAVTPTLVRENALLVWDAGREHLVLELQFARADAKFGMLIPVPGKPEVALLPRSPFAELGAAFPFVVGAPALGNAPAPSTALDLYNETRVGSCTLTVLDARDEPALGRWLDANGLEPATSSAAFRARYPSLGFFFVALRYEASKTPEGPMTSPVMRLSFASPAPYYPYFEPPRAPFDDLRRLSLWLVTRDETLVPIAARGAGFARPLRDGARHHNPRLAFERAVGEVASLLPAGAHLRAQTFEDRKVHRDGFSDVVFVPDKPLEDAGEGRSAAAAWLDPRMVPTATPTAAPSASVPVTPVTATSSRCSTAPGARGSLAPWLVIAAIVGRRWLVALIALGCRRDAPGVDRSPAPVVTPSSSTFTSEDRMREVDAIVRGVLPPAGIPVIAQEPNVPWDPPRRVRSIMVDAVSEGGLTKDVVLATVRASAARFRGCYELGLRTLPSLGGKVTAFLTVGATGVTEKVKLVDTLPHAPTSACLKAVFEQLAFPAKAPRAPSSATIELDLTSSG